MQYVGETRRKLLTRIGEHGKERKRVDEIDENESAISKHVQSCPEYIKLRENEYGPEPSDDDKIKFIKKCFSLSQTNLHNLNQRKIMEAIEIKLKKPTLNNQVFSRNIKFF